MSELILKIKRLLRNWFAKGLREGHAPTARLYESEADEVDASDPFSEPVRLEIGDVLDLHAFAPRDVRAVVEEYLSEARRLGLRQVRIIHGKGVGVQREIVRGILARTPFVERFADAPESAGGWGATIAHLAPRAG